MLEGRILVWGAGGHARVVAEIIRCVGRSEIVGFLDNVNPERHTTEFCGATVLGGAEQLTRLAKEGVSDIVIALGDCSTRLRSAFMAIEAGFHLATVCHPSAVVAQSATIGSGSVLVAGVIINPECVIGSNVIVNTGATVDHECIVEDGVHIGPGVHIGGNSRIGRGAWVGIGATVIDRVTIGAGTIIGAGAVVVHDIPENVVAYGVPAGVKRKLS